MSDKPIAFGTIGIGGYAAAYVRALDYLEEEKRGRFAAAVIRSPKKYAEQMPDLEKRGVNIYPDLESMLKGEELDVVCVPTGISSHVPLSIQAMEAGRDVICEKPLCGTVQEADEIIAARDRLGRRVAIAYQRMWSPTTQEVKRRIVDGPLGAVKRARVKASWPRHDGYYARNSWAGTLKGPDGRWVLDSPAMNACAHYLQHALFIAGPTQHETAKPVKVSAELYRGREGIENFDTCYLDIETAEGAQIIYIVSHCGEHQWGPDTEIECENGKVLELREGGTTVIMEGGVEEKIELDTERPGPVDRVFLNMCDAITKGDAVLSTPDNARQHTLVLNAAQTACDIVQIDPSLIQEADRKDWQGMNHWRFVPGLSEAVAESWEARKPFSQLDLDWAKPGASIETAGYTAFEG